MSGIIGAVIAAVSGAPGIIQAVPNAGGPAASSFGLTNAGAITVNGGGSGNWVSPASAIIAAYYQVKVDVNSGSFTSGDATGAWLDLSTSRAWARTGAGTVNYNVSFREKATAAVRSVQTGKTMIVV